MSTESQLLSEIDSTEEEFLSADSFELYDPLDIPEERRFKTYSFPNRDPALKPHDF